MQVVSILSAQARRVPRMIPDRLKVPAFIGLTVILVLTYARAFRKAVPAARPLGAAGVEHEARAKETPPVVQAAAQATRAQREEQRQHAATLEWRRDPFTSSGVGEEATHSLNLSGILWDPAKPLAIINGQTVQVGDQLGAYRILSINRETVTISDGTATTTLQLTR